MKTGTTQTQNHGTQTQNHGTLMTGIACPTIHGICPTTETGIACPTTEIGIACPTGAITTVTGVTTTETGIACPTMDPGIACPTMVTGATTVACTTMVEKVAEVAKTEEWVPSKTPLPFSPLQFLLTLLCEIEKLCLKSLR